MRFLESSRATHFGSILLFGLLAMTARNAVDPDLWWHLRTGQWILETGHIPHIDPFSFTQAGHAWVAHEWLTEVVFFALWKHGGAATLIVFSAMITTAGFMLLYLRCPGKRHWAAAATALGAWAAAPSWGVRPQMFTFTLASILLWLVHAGEGRPRLLFWIPPLFLLWLNLHAGFALGPALLLAYACGLLLETVVGSTPWQTTRPILLRISLLLLACFALVPLNPSGAHLFRYPLDTLRSEGMRSFIGEWFSPDFHVWMYRPFLLVCLLLFIALASSRSRLQLRGRVAVPLLFTFFAALDAVRHIPIFILVVMPVIAAGIPARSPALADLGRLSSRAPFRPIFNVAIVILITVFTLVKWVSLVREQNAREAAQFPQAAVAFLQASSPPQRIFVYYDWGGYAIWKLYPESRVFVDGRADLYGDDMLRQFKTAVQLRNGWRQVLDGWNVQALLLPSSCALAQALALDPAWHTAFRDSQAIVFLRTPSSSLKTAIFSGNTSPKGQQSEKMFPRVRPNLRN
jgi:hypothetical protein